MSRAWPSVSAPPLAPRTHTRARTRVHTQRESVSSSTELQGLPRGADSAAPSTGDPAARPRAAAALWPLKLFPTDVQPNDFTGTFAELEGEPAGWARPVGGRVSSTPSPRNRGSGTLSCFSQTSGGSGATAEWVPGKWSGHSEDTGSLSSPHWPCARGSWPKAPHLPRLCQGLA